MVKNTADSSDLIARLYRNSLRIRRVEEFIVRVYDQDLVKSPVHLSIGQEAVSVAVCDHLKPQDVVYATYRGHAAYLAKGGDIAKMAAELFGKDTGSSRGKAGSMHLGDIDVNMITTSAIVGTGIPNAVGHAFALKQQKSDAVVVCFFGEGATDEGVFHESLNFAGLKNLPILFVCENNQYAIYSHQRDRMAQTNLCERAAVYGISSKWTPGKDMLDLHSVAGEAISAIQSTGKPQFLELETYRWRDHVGPGEDRHIGYRTDEELDQWIKDDLIEKLALALDPSVRVSIDAEVNSEVETSFAAAESAAFPDNSVMYSNVYR